MTLAISPTVHPINRVTPVYVGLGGYDTSDMFVSPGYGAGPYLWRPILTEDRPSTSVPAVRILPGDILDIDGIGRYLVGRPGPLEPRLTPA